MQNYLNGMGLYKPVQPKTFCTVIKKLSPHFPFWEQVISY